MELTMEAGLEAGLSFDEILGHTPWQVIQIANGRRRAFDRLAWTTARLHHADPKKIPPLAKFLGLKQQDEGTDSTELWRHLLNRSAAATAAEGKGG